MAELSVENQPVESNNTPQSEPEQTKSDELLKTEGPEAKVEWFSPLPEPLQERVKKLNSMEALAKAYAELEDVFHQKRKGIEVPKEDEGEDAWSKFYDFLRPKDSSKYSLEDKEGKELNPLNNADAMMRLRQAFYNNGLSNKQAKALTEFLGSENQTAFAEKSKRDSLIRQENEDKLKHKWADKYDYNVALAQRVFEEIVPTKEERVKFKEAGYTNSPEFIELLNRVGKLVSSDDDIKSLRANDGSFKSAKSKDILEKEYRELLMGVATGAVRNPYHAQKRLMDLQVQLGHDKD